MRWSAESVRDFNLVLHQTKSGTWLRVVLRDGDTAKILVPRCRRGPLIARAHLGMHHASWKKVLAALRARFVVNTNGAG